MNLNMFFKEKVIPSTTFDFTLPSGELHIVENEFVIQLCKDSKGGERTFIKNTLMKIDFANGNVNHFLKHLAKCYVAAQYGDNCNPELLVEA